MLAGVCLELFLPAMQKVDLAKRITSPALLVAALLKCAPFEISLRMAMCATPSLPSALLLSFAVVHKCFRHQLCYFCL